MELYHHGVKGQRWGIRRYQNEDGTYTEAGKVRYRKGQRDAEYLAKRHADLYDPADAYARRDRENKQQKIKPRMSPSDLVLAPIERGQKYLRAKSLMKLRWEVLEDSAYNADGKAYIMTCLGDRITGDIYKSIVELPDWDYKK